MNVARVFDVSGKRVAQTRTVELLPGFGIQFNGEHIEGGPHTLPADIAWSLVSTSRARFVDEETDEIDQRDPVAENRDPAVKSTKGKR